MTNTNSINNNPSEKKCQMSGCSRGVTGNYTRQMYSSEDGENWPDDVSERPICWYHHFLLESVKAGAAGAAFGLFIGVAGLITSAENVFYFYSTIALLTGLLLSEIARRLGKGQVVSNE